ncbi:hypothetical protein [Scytonema sp. UIC 10036]|uniref:hypothetical protein n=1 Tax=Scytonema sp. UIC 10036 TaxID=2304196 RepID=UPI001FAA590B|nr:hypothetical protein [Scytonema sp. UIC 10036]
MMTIFGTTKLAATIALQYQAIAFWVRMEREIGTSSPTIALFGVWFMRYAIALL